MADVGPNSVWRPTPGCRWSSSAGQPGQNARVIRDPNRFRLLTGGLKLKTPMKLFSQFARKSKCNFSRLRGPRPTRPLDFEFLEDRILLASSPGNVFATFSGVLLNSTDTSQVNIAVLPADFSGSNSPLLGFHVKAANSSLLDPAAVHITDRGSLATVTPTYSANNVRAGVTDSVVLAPLALSHQYTVAIRGENNTQGAYDLEVFIPGDVDSNRGDTLADGTAIRNLLGAQAGDGKYKVEADANLDGTITAYDYTQWRTDNGLSTDLNPLAINVQLTPTPVTLPDNSLATNVAAGTLSGTTNPNDPVTLVMGGNASTTANSAGAYSLPVTLAPGTNTLQVQVSDGFGQRRTVALQVRLQPQDQQPPVITAQLVNDTAPGGGTNTDGLTSDPTISGTVTDASRVTRFLAGFDSTPTSSFFDVFTDLRPDGSFTFDRARLEQIRGASLTDGPHTLHLQAADEFGNVSSFFDVFFQLDTLAPTASIGPSGTVTTTFSVLDVFYSEPMADSASLAGNYALQIDGGPNAGQPVGINSAFRVSSTNVRLNLSELLPNDNYRLTINPGVSDPAGNALAPPTVFRFTVNQSFQIAEFSPADGEEMVSLDRETIVRFSGQVDPATVNADSFYLIANGERLPGTIRVSSTERFATFFYANSLPPSTEVRVVVEGDQIRDRDGVALDADGDGNPGGRGMASFRTLPLTRIPGTNLFGFVYDAYNKNSDGSNIPIVGATIRVDAFPEANAVTDANGRFELDNMPAPEFFVHVDGSTAHNAPPARHIPPWARRSTVSPARRRSCS